SCDEPVLSPYNGTALRAPTPNRLSHRKKPLTLLGPYRPRYERVLVVCVGGFLPLLASNLHVPCHGFSTASCHPPRVKAEIDAHPMLGVQRTQAHHAIRTACVQSTPIVCYLFLLMTRNHNFEGQEETLRYFCKLPNSRNNCPVR